MTTRSIFPVVPAADVRRSRDFYRELLALTVVFDSTWYAQLHGHDDTVQLGVVALGHDTVPASYRHTPRGVLISVEVDDVDAVHERAVAAGHRIVLDLRDEDFGQRHFMTVDPDGLLVDVITVIPYSDEMIAEGAVAMSREK